MNSPRALTALTLLLAAVLVAAAGSSVSAESLDSSVRQRKGLGRKASKLRRLVRAAIARDARLGAALLRLAFHDAFAFDPATGKGGANGSIRFELDRPENGGLQDAVTALARMKRSTKLGWGDVVAVAGAEAVSTAGGPRIRIRLGRKNAREGDPEGTIPRGDDNLAQLRGAFAPRGFSDTDLVALSGGHTLGRVGGTLPFVRQSTVFKNDYFVNLKWFIDQREAGQSDAEGPPITPNFQLPSDLALISDPKTTRIVKRFAKSERAFFKAFVRAYKKMADSGF